MIARRRQSWSCGGGVNVVAMEMENKELDSHHSRLPLEISFAHGMGLLMGHAIIELDWWPVRTGGGQNATLQDRELAIRYLCIE